MPQPRIVLSGSSEGLKRWRARRIAAGLPILALLVVNIVRLGVLDHNWWLAGIIIALMVLAIPITMTLLRRRDEARLAEASPGTVFVGGADLSLEQLRSQTAFKDSVAKLKWWRQSVMSVRFVLTESRIRL